MNFSEAISDGFTKYATFSGRSSRSAFWWWFLFWVLVLIAASIVDSLITVSIAFRLALLGLLLPNLAVLVRRLHDVDRSGWWALIWFAPFVGPIVLVVFACTDSAPANKYGAGPDGKSDMTATSQLGLTLPPPPPPTPQSPPPGEMPPPAPGERAPD